MSPLAQKRSFLTPALNSCRYGTGKPVVSTTDVHGHGKDWEPMDHENGRRERGKNHCIFYCNAIITLSS